MRNLGCFLQPWRPRPPTPAGREKREGLLHRRKTHTHWGRTCIALALARVTQQQRARASPPIGPSMSLALLLVYLPLIPLGYAPGTLPYLSSLLPHAPVARQIVASESLAVTTAKATIGIASTPITLASLFSLTTTGCGLPGELLGALEGLAYVVVTAFAISSLFTRVTTGGDLRAAELRSAAEEAASLEASGASEVRVAFSAQKVQDLGKTNGPADLLAIAEKLSLLTAALAVLVLGAKLAITGSLPSAVPSAGGACWEL